MEALGGPLPPATNWLSFPCTNDASKVNEFQLQVEVWLRVGLGKVKARSPAHDQVHLALGQALSGCAAP